MEDETLQEAPIHVSHHISLRKIALFSILALIITAGIAFAIKNLINKEVSPSEIISKSKIPTLVPGSNVTIMPTAPPTTNMTNWKIYKNDKFGFEINYPKSLEVKEFQKTDPNTLYVSFSSTEEQMLPKMSIAVGDQKAVRNDYSYGSFLWVESVLDRLKNVSIGKSSESKTDTITKTNESIFGGLKGTIYRVKTKSGVPTEGENSLNLALINKSSSYLVSYNKEIGNSQDFTLDELEEFDQILSTFKFTDQSL